MFGPSYFDPPLEQFFLTQGQNNFGNKIPMIKNFVLHRFTSPTSPSKRTLPSTAAVVANNAAAALVAAAQNNQQKLPLPDSRSMDWSSLVNTATKAIKTDEETTIVDLEANNEATMASKSRKLPEKRYILSLTNVQTLEFDSSASPENF